MKYNWTSVDGLLVDLTQLLEDRHPGLVTDLRLALEGDTIVLRGEVASEACKGDAKRLVLAFEGVFKVRNELVVAAFLEAASDPDMDDFFTTRGYVFGLDDQDVGPVLPSQTNDDGGLSPHGSVSGAPSQTPVPLVNVSRHPEVVASSVPRADEWVDITIDLSDTPHQGVAPLPLGSFPEDWVEIEISVHMIAPWASQTIATVPIIRLRSDGGSEPARFRCQTSPNYEEGSPAEVQAVFLHGTRICGHTIRDVAQTDGKKEPGSDVKAASASARLETEFNAGLNAIGPNVSISILRNGARAQNWVWTAFVPGGTTVGTGRVELDGDDREFAESLLKTCPDLEFGKFQRTMDGIGERLWDSAPAEFRAAYAGWRSTIGVSFAMQFVTDDPYVPWEMMKPRLPDAKHLFFDHPVARWPLSRAGRRRDRFEGGEILSFVPKYKNRDALAFAIAEGEWICNELGASAMSADVTTFLDVLDGNHSGAVGMVHFAGHGCEHTGVSSGGIKLEDGVVSVTDVHQQRVVLGQRDGTLMVLNACETSAGARLLGMNTGWGAAIADREFGGLIAPLWEVQDEAAFAIMQATLPALLDGRQSMGEAVMRGRLAKSGSSVAAFAYLAHGDVMAKFSATP